MKRILVVNVNWLGDVVFSSPLFGALKEYYPDAQINCLAVPRVKEVLEAVEAVNDVLVYDEDGKDRGLLAKWRLIQRIRKDGYDAVFFLSRSFSRALMVYLAGVPQRIGYDNKGRRIFLTHVVSPVSKEAHRLDGYLKVIESYGVPVKSRQTKLVISKKEEEEVNLLLQDKGVVPSDPLIVIHVGANWNLKRWPSANFAKLMDRLSREAQAKVVVPGSANDTALAKEILSQTKMRPVDLTNQTSLGQLMALMKRAEIVISADSGPMHIASSVGTDVVALFGPTRPEITGPKGEGKTFVLQKDVGCNQKPCYYLKCPDNVCMQAITVEDVCEKVKEIRS